VGNRIDRAGFFAGIAANADFGIDQMLPYQYDLFGSIHGGPIRIGRVKNRAGAMLLPALLA
jgi:hypothetical protein